MTMEYKVKVHATGKNGAGGVGFMYWTWSGATVNPDDAAIFTDETMPSFFKQSLNQPYVEKVYI